MSIPNISEVVVFGPDAGYNTCKAAGARITDLTRKDIQQIKARIVTTEFRSYHAPLLKNVNASGRLLRSPEEGIVGEDAKDLQQRLWTASLSEDRYVGHAWRLFFWALLYDILDASSIPDGSHVQVFTAFGLPEFHMGYADALRASLHCNDPQVLEQQGGKRFYVTLEDSPVYDTDGNQVRTTLDIQTQPFWIVVDQVLRWEDKGLVPHADLLKGGLVVLDFGSKTTLGIKCVNNLVPVAHIAVPLGTWHIVQDFVAPAINAERQRQHISVGNIRWQEAMQVYEDGGFLTIGQHDPLDISDGLLAYIQEKVNQRLDEINAQLDGGADTRTIICAGGDVEANFDALAEMYANNISGDFRIATDDDGNPEPKYRQMHGALKGAVKAWVETIV